MKNSLLLLAGVAATLSLGACSQNKTTETTTTTAPADSTGTATTTSTTRTYSDADYHSRGDRMAAKFAAANKITDEATLAKLKTAYYNRAKRYDEMTAKYAADTTGMAAARRDYSKANDQEFQTVLVAPTQYQAYQSSQSDYDESSNLDVTDQGAASSDATSSADNTTTTDASASTDMSGGVGVEKSKTKLEDGSKLKVNSDGDVKTKDANGNKNVDVQSGAALKDSKTKLTDGSKVKVKGDGTIKLKDADGSKTKL